MPNPSAPIPNRLAGRSVCAPTGAHFGQTRYSLLLRSLPNRRDRLRVTNDQLLCLRVIEDHSPDAPTPDEANCW
jgi:hypothetical protein